MARAYPNVYSIPAGIAFARALCEGIVRRVDRDPFRLADTFVLVPTRRAARNLSEAFAEVLGGSALLPRIRALGDVGEEDGDVLAIDETLPPAIAPLRRLLLLAMLVERWSKAKRTAMPFTHAFHLARDLAGLVDEALTQHVDLRRLDMLAPLDLAAHWRDVADFLKIVAEHWPVQLQAEGAIDAADKRNAELRRLKEALTERPPKEPVIAAGSTGSIPATADLLKAIAHLPTGAVVLPGLDMTLDDTSWESLEPAHPQYGLKALLAHIGVGRADVAPWYPVHENYPSRPIRVRFLSEALRPPPTTDAWRMLLDTEGSALAPALDNFSLIEAATPREEALIIACALREALETPGRTAALVTPDRDLARRVAAELTRWDIDIDDSAGRPLSLTPPGVFLCALASAAAEDFAPVPLLTLLKHPLAAGGEDRISFLHRSREFEAACLRGLRPEPGLEGLAARLETARAHPRLERWLKRVTHILQPLAEALARPSPMLAELAQVHGEVAEALAATDAESGPDRLWCKEAGEAAATLVSDLIQHGGDIALSHGPPYADLFRALADTRAVRPPYNPHPRLAILGPLEARLLDFDLVILGGLNEGTWPGAAASDPWLSRPMRAQLGLEAPERRLGLAAHDFVTLAASRNVLLTRSLKENGAPTVPSRWLLRIQQLAKGLKQADRLASRSELLAWARAVDEAPRERRAQRPQPRPPADARPRLLRITEIETWLRDPYAIYARRVLGLEPLKPIDAEPGPPERGTAIHDALERFLKEHPGTLPQDALARLLEFGRQAFAKAGATHAALALWWPRFERAARWFIAYETERRQQIARSHLEVSGVLQIAAPNPFQLKGRADRIDIHADGDAAIIDYKTGRVPSAKQIEKLLSPQLPLEGAMLLKAAFPNIAARRLSELVHVQLTGGVPPGRQCIARLDAEAKAMEALAKLERRIAQYDDERQPYRSREMPFRLSDVGDYDHLARVREWTKDAEEEE